MLRLAFDFIITWRETRTRPNAYFFTVSVILAILAVSIVISVLLFLHVQSVDKGT